MIALPAIDLREGTCVQLVGGRYDAERIRLPDPVAVATEWRTTGFTGLHVIDLDAATGRGHNRPTVERLLALGLPTQVGGGIRDETAIARLLGAGAARVIVGTRALQDPDWLEQMATRHPDRIVVALDVQARKPVIHGWATELTEDIRTILERLARLPLASVLMTAVHREGRLEGPDLQLMEDVVNWTRLPLQASGGIRSADDLRTLGRIGVAHAVLGMSLYTKTLDPRAIAEEFSR